MAISATFSTLTVVSVPVSRRWAIVIPAGRPVWVSIGHDPAGDVKKGVESAQMQGGTNRVFQSNGTDTFLSVWATDPTADATPISIAFLDSGAGT